MSDQQLSIFSICRLVNLGAKGTGRPSSAIEPRTVRALAICRPEPSRRFGPAARACAADVGAYFSRMSRSALTALAPFGPGFALWSDPVVCLVMRPATVIPVRGASPVERCIKYAMVRRIDEREDWHER